jgi:hypothetical protein
MSENIEPKADERAVYLSTVAASLFGNPGLANKIMKAAELSAFLNELNVNTL